eukprot:1517931-Prymnesium_polylepis.1
MSLPHRTRAHLTGVRAARATRAQADDTNAEDAAAEGGSEGDEDDESAQADAWDEGWDSGTAPLSLEIYVERPPAHERKPSLISPDEAKQRLSATLLNMQAMQEANGRVTVRA